MARRRGNGEGSVVKRTMKRADGSSYFRYQARVTVLWDGKDKKTESGPLRKKHAEASVDLAELLSARQEGRLNTSPHQTLGNYLEAWLEQLSARVKYRTFDTYDKDLRRYVMPRLGTLRLDKLRKIDVQTMLDDVHRDMVSRGKRGEAVTRKACAALRKALQDAVDLELLQKNPCLGVKVPAEHINQVGLWTVEEASRFVRAARDSHIYAHIFVSLNTGLRQGELLALRWGDLEVYPDLDVPGELVGHLHIRHTLIPVSDRNRALADRKPNMKHLMGRYYLDLPKTLASLGVVGIDAATVRVLERHRAEQVERRRPFKKAVDLSLICSGVWGQPMNVTSLTKTFQDLMDSAGVPRIKWHDLRDTHATHLLIAGEDLGTVSERLRHSTKSTTLNRYIQVLPHRRRKAAGTFNTLLNLDD